MKYFFITCLLATAFFSCKDSGTADETIEDDLLEDYDEVVVIEEEPTLTIDSYIIEDVNASTYRFADAITAFEEKDNRLAASELQQGAAALKKEGQSLKGEAATRLKTTIKSLEELAIEVEIGSVKDITRIQKAVAAAQLTVAHEYALSLQEYTVFEPMPDAYYPHYKSAINAVMMAEPLLTGMAKTEARKLVDEAVFLLTRMDAGETIAEADIKAERAKLETFLARHHK